MAINRGFRNAFALNLDGDVVDHNDLPLVPGELSRQAPDIESISIYITHTGLNYAASGPSTATVYVMGPDDLIAQAIRVTPSDDQDYPLVISGVVLPCILRAHVEAGTTATLSVRVHIDPRR